jgi:hypothetical protein
MGAGTRTATVGALVVATAFLLVPSARSAQSPTDPSARLPCVFFNPSLGEYGASVFRLLHKPGRCGPTYTRLRMRLPRHRLHGHLQPIFQSVFKLPACGRPFDYI